VTLDDLIRLKSQKPGLRGPELLEWGRYIQLGGPIYPLSLFSKEGANAPTFQEISTYTFAPGIKLSLLNKELWQKLKRPENEFPNSPEEIINLLAEGADVNYRGLDNLRWTPLHFAANVGDLRLVEVLLQGGADINATTNQGRTALMIAVNEQKGAEIVNLLLTHGACSLIADVNKNTVFHFNALKKNPEVSEVLLNFDSEITAFGLRRKNSTGFCPGENEVDS